AAYQRRLPKRQSGAARTLTFKYLLEWALVTLLDLINHGLLIVHVQRMDQQRAPVVTDIRTDCARGQRNRTGKQRDHKLIGELQRQFHETWPQAPRWPHDQ